MKSESLVDLINKVFQGRRYEPTKRLHDWYGHHSHRFPIKGGITFAEVMAKEMYATNPLLKSLMRRASMKGASRT